MVKSLILLTEPITEKMLVGGPVARALIAAILIALAIGLFFFINGLIARTYD